MLCKQCGTENPEEAKFCKGCGKPLQVEAVAPQPEAAPESVPTPTSETPVPTPQPMPQPEPQQYTQQSSVPKSTNNGYATASLVLGIVSIVLCCIPIVSIICGILGILFSRKANKMGVANGFTKAGFICGIIGTCLGVIYMIYWIYVIVLIGHADSTFSHYYNYNF